MLGDCFASAKRPNLPEIKWRRGSARRCLFFWNRTWTILLLVVAIVVPWASFSRSARALTPSRYCAGTSSVPITSLAFSNDGQTLATTDESGRATLWHVADGWSRGEAIEVRGRAQFVAFAADGRYLALGGDQPSLGLWDLQRRSWVPSPQIPVRSPSDMKISPDGRTVAVASHDSPEVVLWDLATGRKRLTLSGHRDPVMHLAFAPDGRSLASAAGMVRDAPIRIWNVATGRPERVINRVGGAVQTIEFSPDGNLLASACPHEKAVRIWDVHTGSQARVIAGHFFSTRSVAFSPDGRLLAKAAGDGTGGLWNVSTGRQIRRLDGEADVLRNVAFTPDGRTLAATGNDGNIRFWGVDELIGGRPDE
jgi:WD40 repeat protein